MSTIVSFYFYLFYKDLTMMTNEMHVIFRTDPSGSTLAEVL